MSVYDYTLDDGLDALARTERCREDAHYDRPGQLEPLGGLADGLEQAVAQVDYEVTTRLARVLGILGERVT